MFKKISLLLFLASILTLAYADQDLNAKMVELKIKKFMQTNHVPGVALTLVENGKSHDYYFGYADIKKKRPVTKYTMFELGSITKLMTSLILAQQIDYAKMQLDTPITKYIANLPKELSHITVRDLATHTSGLPFDVPKNISDHAHLNTYLTQWHPQINVKNAWQYSNFGMGLLGVVLENATKKTFAQLYLTRIRNPLGMKSFKNKSVSYLKQFDAQGYDQDNHPVQPFKKDAFISAYGAKASITDMHQFLNAAIGLPGTPKRILYPMRITQSAYIRLPDNFQGLGWQIHEVKLSQYQALMKEPQMGLGPLKIKEKLEVPRYDGDALIDKTGATSGFRAYIAVIPNKKAGIVFLTNKFINSKELVDTARSILFEAISHKS